MSTTSLLLRGRYVLTDAARDGCGLIEDGVC